MGFTPDPTTGVPLNNGTPTGEGGVALEERAVILNNHIKDNGPHGATSSNTAGQIIRRDSATSGFSSGPIITTNMNIVGNGGASPVLVIEESSLAPVWARIRNSTLDSAFELGVSAGSGQFFSDASTGDLIFKGYGIGVGAILFGVGNGAASLRVGTAGAIGFAGTSAGLTLSGPSSTGTNRTRAGISIVVVDNTDATRSYAMELSASDYNGSRKGVRVEADGSAARLGFYGGTAVAKQTLAAAATDAATTQTLANSLRSALIALGLTS